MVIFRQLTFNKDLRQFKQGLTIDFLQPMTLIAGDNGSGKSTLLMTIYAQFQDKYSELWTDTQCWDVVSSNHADNVAAVFINSAVANKKHAESLGDNLGLQVQQMKCSSGQGHILTFNKLKNVQNSLILLDEPARSLSIKNRNRIAQLLLMLQEKGNQLIVATHSTEILRFAKKDSDDTNPATAKIFNCDDQQWCDYETFLISQWK